MGRALMGPMGQHSAKKTGDPLLLIFVRSYRGENTIYIYINGYIYIYVYIYVYMTHTHMNEFVNLIVKGGGHIASEASHARSKATRFVTANSHNTD